MTVDITRPAKPSRVREHGTVARYNHGPDINDQPGKGCRCTPCRAAQSAALREYRKRKAREAWGAKPAMVDAEPVRVHVRSLMTAGIGWERIADLAGVGKTTLGLMLYGFPGCGRPRTKRVRRETAEKLLAVTGPEPADGATIDATGTHRRLQALIAIGWSGTELMRRLGKIKTNLPYIFDRARVRLSTARAVQALYDELWDQPPPEETAYQRRFATMARNRAARNGWPPPMAWDDDTIDDPAAQPDLGDQAPRAAALYEDSEELLRQGHTLEQAAERLGVNKAYLQRARACARRQAAA